MDNVTVEWWCSECEHTHVPRVPCGEVYFVGQEKRYSMVCNCEKTTLGPPTPMKPVQFNTHCCFCNDHPYPCNESALRCAVHTIENTTRPLVDAIVDKDYLKGSTRNPWLNQVLSKIAQLHDKKNHDYCPDDDNPFFNFEVSDKYNMACWGAKEEVDATVSFNILLGTKLARLYALLERGSSPNNEAFIDSEWDYVVYFLLRESYTLKMEEEKK